jgi:capsular polysaccharide transport system permease protein
MNDIIHTLVIKDIKTRFYGDRLAYLWDLINPLAWIGALVVFFSILEKQVPIYTDIISFLIPGMLAYVLFRNTMRSIIRSKKTSQAILPIPSITTSTVILAAAYIELLNSMIVFSVLILLNFLLFNKIECYDPLIMIFGYLCAWGTGLAFGCLALELCNYFPMFEKILPILLRPVFWISGIFYTANELPEWLSEIAGKNPLFQSIEIIRDGTFLSYQSRMANYYQPIFCILGIIGLAFLLHQHRSKNS